MFPGPPEPSAAHRHQSCNTCTTCRWTAPHLPAGSAAAGTLWKAAADAKKAKLAELALVKLLRKRDYLEDRVTEANRMIYCYSKYLKLNLLMVYI